MTRNKAAAISPDVEAEDVLKAGYVWDYVSGVAVKASPEEVEAVQVFAQRLVEDYSYPKSHLQTRPQFRVRKRPSDEAKAYPVDIAVFRSGARHEDDLYLLVECKKKNGKDGVAQLKLYLDMSPAELGVWFAATSTSICGRFTRSRAHGSITSFRTSPGTASALRISASSRGRASSRRRT